MIRNLGLRDYQTTLAAMQHYTLSRDADSHDEFWCVEHPPVFTAGLTSKSDDLLNPKDIPVVNIDRGGQVTYHGPGQIIIYTLIDLPRKKLGVKALVNALEQSLIDLLQQDYDISAQRRDNAPGVYVGQSKIASLGLRIKKGRSYHGLSLNVAMDLEPFQRIIPCGLHDITMTQITAFQPQASIEQVRAQLITHLCQQLGYNQASVIYKDALPT